MNHTLTITERERQVILEALKFLTDLFQNAAPVETPKAAPPAPTTPEQTGVQSTAITQISARIWKAEPGTTLKGLPCMRVQWGTMPAQPGHGRETFSATCFDTKFFPALENAVRSGQTIKFSVKRRGDFLNIVNVAA